MYRPKRLFRPIHIRLLCVNTIIIKNTLKDTNSRIFCVESNSPIGVACSRSSRRSPKMASTTVVQCVLRAVSPDHQQRLWSGPLEKASASRPLLPVSFTEHIPPLGHHAEFCRRRPVGRSLLLVWSLALRGYMYLVAILRRYTQNNTFDVYIHNIDINILYT